MFGSYAKHYDRYRPTFPRLAIDWLCADSAAVGEQIPRRDVLDLGAGTGKLTQALMAAGHRVTAVEPSDGMRELLAVNCPTVDVLAGTAEDIPLADASVDVVTAGQAMHWFDLPRALPEISRVLRPGGHLAVVWNHFDDSIDWVARFCDMNMSEARLSRADEITDDWEPWFGRAVRAGFDHQVAVTSSELAGLAESFSTVALLTETERVQTLAQVRAMVPAGATWALPYVAVCFRAARR